MTILKENKESTAMEKVLDQFTQTMGIRNFSPSTKKIYASELQKYLHYCKDLECMQNSESFQEFLFYRIKEEKISECTLKHAIGAAKFFFLCASHSV